MSEKAQPPKSRAGNPTTSTETTTKDPISLSRRKGACEESGKPLRQLVLSPRGTTQKTVRDPT